MTTLLSHIQSWRKIYAGIFTLVLTGALLYFCLQKIDPKTFWIGIQTAHSTYLLTALLLTFSIIFLHAYQLKLFLPEEKKISFKKLFENYSVFAMMVNLLPFWGGHALFVYLLGHREKVGKAATVSMLTLEQIADGFGKLFIFAWVALFAPIPVWMSKGMKIILAFILLGYLILFFLAFRFKNFQKDSTNSPKTFFEKIAHFFKTWAFHLHTLRSFRKTAISFSVILLIKFLETFSIYLIQQAFGIHLPIHAAVLMMAALGISGMLPVTPAQLGLFEATALLVYQYLGIDPTHSLLIGFFAHLVRMIPFLGVGYFCSLKIGFRRGEMKSVTSS